MVEYKYNVELEMFRRVDNRGPSLPFNIVEARRIQSMMDLGMKAPTIYKKIDFVNEVSMTNLRTFMNNLVDGNIVGLDDDYPAPTEQFEKLNMEVRVASLEDKVDSIEDRLSELKSNCFCTAFAGESKKENSLFDKVKSWIN